MVSILAFHAGYRGSSPRTGTFFSFFMRNCVRHQNRKNWYERPEQTQKRGYSASFREEDKICRKIEKCTHPLETNGKKSSRRIWYKIYTNSATSTSEFFLGVSLHKFDFCFFWISFFFFCLLAGSLSTKNRATSTLFCVCSVRSYQFLRF